MGRQERLRKLHKVMDTKITITTLADALEFYACMQAVADYHNAMHDSGQPSTDFNGSLADECMVRNDAVNHEWFAWIVIRSGNAAHYLQKHAIQMPSELRVN